MLPKPSGPMTAVVVGQQNPLQTMGSNFRGSQARLGKNDLLACLALLAVVVAGVWLLRRLLAYQESRRPFNHPRKLFRELCRLHGLDAIEQRLLKKVAAQHHLAQPAMLFVQADLFDSAVLASALAPQSQRLLALRDRLFADHACRGESEKGDSRCEADRADRPQPEKATAVDQ